MHFVDRKPKGEQPRLLTPHPDTSILYSSCPDGGTGRRKGLKIPGPQGCAGSIPALGTKTKRTGTIQIHTRLPFKISPFTLVVAIANANRRGFSFFLPPSSPHLHPPRSPCGQDGMFSSILCGLEALTSRGELEGLAVHPEDTPEAYRSLPVDLLSLDSGRNLPT